MKIIIPVLSFALLSRASRMPAVNPVPGHVWTDSLWMNSDGPVAFYNQWCTIQLNGTVQRTGQLYCCDEFQNSTSSPTDPNRIAEKNGIGCGSNTYLFLNVKASGIIDYQFDGKCIKDLSPEKNRETVVGCCWEDTNTKNLTCISRMEYNHLRSRESGTNLN